MYATMLPSSRRSLPPEPLLVLGETTYRRQFRRFGLLAADRLRHAWVLGKTGSGKSTLLANMVIQDLAQGNGLALLDPHGDLVNTVLPFVPRHRVNEVLLIEPSDRDWPVSFNVFRQGRQLHGDPALLTSQLVTVFKRFWRDTWGPRLEHILRNSILAIADRPQATLLYLYRFLTDPALREHLTPTITDPVVAQFWTKEFPSYAKALQAEAMSPVRNKLGAFVSHPIVRNIVSQERSRVDFVDLMNRRAIVLANLSVGHIGEDASRLLGGLIITAIHLSAMERPRGGPPFYLYADEFQNFVTDSLATLLAESRKFNLGLILAHQYLAQLPDGIRDAVLGNVGTSVVFRVGGQDAEILAPEFAPVFSAPDLQTLERYHVAIKMVIRGESPPPFSARTLATPMPPPASAEQLAKIREQAHLRFCARRDDVEAAIARLLRSSP